MAASTVILDKLNHTHTYTHVEWANIACLWYHIKLIEIANILNFQMSNNQDSNGCFSLLFHNLNLNEW